MEKLTRAHTNELMIRRPEISERSELRGKKLKIKVSCMKGLKGGGNLKKSVLKHDRSSLQTLGGPF